MGTALDAGDALVLIAAGEPVPIPGGADQTYRFKSHANYYYLTEQECPGGVLAYDGASGWEAFAPPVTAQQRLWEGDVEWEGRPLAELAGWLAARRGRPIASLGSPLPGLAHDAPLSVRLGERMLHARRVKDDAEIAKIRAAAAMTAAGFRRARECIRAGVTEREAQIEIEAAFFRAGAETTGYSTIVGSGEHAAVLHYIRGEAEMRAGELVLIDAGAEAGRYCADVTRTLPVEGAASSIQRDLLELVLEMECVGIEACRVGTEWHDVHRAANERLMAGLAAIGLVRGDPAELVSRGLAGLFMPHGIGHMVGLGVRDAGGREPGRADRLGPGGVRIRVDLPLRAGYLMTVEPGIYFVKGLIDDPVRRDRFADAADWAAVDRVRREVHGIRIEDNVLVREEGPEVLTAEIEGRMW
jgi:Xaa-Pro aminopeptidase